MGALADLASGERTAPTIPFDPTARKVKHVSRAETLNYPAIFEKAHKAGLDAGSAHKPTPMTVRSSGALGTGGEREYYVPDGACGFAWVRIPDGRSKLAREAKACGFRSDSYYGGVTLWVDHFGQSYERKTQYAKAYARVVEEATRMTVLWAGRLD